MELIKQGNKYITKSTYDERFIPKGAGFFWNPKEFYWWTDDKSKALLLIDYVMDAETLKSLKEYRKLQNIEISKSLAIDANIEIPVPENLEYRPFQRAGIAFAQDKKNILIGDEMGLGKTIQALGIINLNQDIKSILILCPASLRLNWYREAKKWLVKDLGIVIACGKNFPKSDIVICNYDILKNHKDVIQSKTWDLLICDESHYLKNPKAQRTAMVFGKWHKTVSKKIPAIQAKKKVFLTGTPIVNRPVELWPLVKATGVITSWKYYTRRYCNAKDNSYGFDVSGSSNMKELQDKLRSTIMIRRLKKDVLPELPAKNRQVIEIPANGCWNVIKKEQEAWEAQKERIELLQKAVELAKISDNDKDYTVSVKNLSSGIKAAFTEISILRHETALAKVPVVLDHLRELTEENDKKVVVFAHHKDVIKAIEKEFLNKCVKLTGDMSVDDRQISIDRFQDEENCKLFIGSLTAAGVGINLTASSHVVFAEGSYVPGHLSQAEDRCHRIGQENSVLIQHIVLEGSIDCNIARTVVKKQAVIDKILDNIEKTELSTEPIIPLNSPGKSTISRVKIIKQAEDITDEEKTEIHNKLKVLASYCDGAKSIDGMGFNKFDAGLGKDLAGCKKLTDRQAVYGKYLIEKYRKQLKN